MALTRKFLAALGIEAEKVDEIIEAHTETVNALKKERDDYKADVEKYKPDAEKLSEVQKELDQLKEEHEGNPYKEKYEKEHKDFEDYKTEIAQKEAKQKKESAFRAMLKEVGVSEKRFDAIVKVSDIESIELESDGKIKNSDKMKESIKSEWADFITTEGQKGANSQNPPDGNGGGNPNKSRAAEIAARHYASLYGEKKGEQQ